MAAEIAPLGFEIDTSPLTGAQKAAEQTAASLDKMGVAAEKAASKTKKATDDLKGTAEAAKGAGAAAGKAADQLNGAAKGADNAAKSAAVAGMNVKQLMEALKQVQGHAAGSGQAIQNLTGQLGTMAQTIGQGGGTGALTGGLTNSIGLFGRLATVLGPVGGLVAGAAGGVAALGAGFVALSSTLATVQDRYALLEGRLKNIYGSSTVAKQMFAEIATLAGKNAVAIDQAAESFLRLARNNEAIGLTRRQMVDLTDAVQMLGRVSGASQGELASGMLQFSQALASGRLSGDELRTIMENMPALAKSIAQGMGVSVGQMRALGAEGQLTGDKITKALLDQLPKIKAEFEGLPPTTEQAFTRVTNAWDTMLATMGQKLNSSKIMQYLAGSVEGVISTINDAIRDETPQEARARIISGSRASGRNPVPRYSKGQADAMLYDVFEQSRAAGMLNTSAMRDEADANLRAPFTQSQRVIEELDPARKKSQELIGNIATLEKVIANFKKSRNGLFEQQEIETISRYNGYISLLKKQLDDALPALEKFNRETLKQRKDAQQYGFGTDIGAEIRKLTGTVDSDGREVSAERATSSVIFRRTTSIEGQTAAIEKQIDAQRKRIESLGKGAEAEREAEASAKALQLRIEQFGNLEGKEIDAVINAYTAALIDLAKAQDAAAAKQALLNAQIDLAAQRAAAGAVAAGSGAMQEAERNSRRAAALANAKPEDVASLRTQYAAEDQARANSEAAQLRRSQQEAATQRRLAGGMSPADAARARREQEARQFSEGFSDATQREIAYQTKLTELRAKDAAAIRQGIDAKLNSLAMTEQEIALTKTGSLEERVAIARARELNAIRMEGIDIGQEELNIRLQIAEAEVRAKDQLEKATEKASRYKQLWDNIGQSVAGAFDDAFSKMLDGQRVKFKDFAKDILKDITQIVIRNQITEPLANSISSLGQGAGLSGGSSGGGVASTIASSLTKSVASTLAKAANDNAATGAAAGTGTFATVGNFLARGANKVDPRLTDILKTAAERGGFNVEAYSGYRPGDPRFHGDGLAVDTRMYKNGKALPNYQNSTHFRDYEQYAQTARMVQMEKYPELADQFRWGGYFSGPKGKYGAADLQHFDLGGGNGLGMAGGSWESGLTPAQRKLFPGAESRGIGDLIAKWAEGLKGAEAPLKNIVPAMSDVAKNANDVAPAMGDLSSGLSSLFSSLLRGVMGMFGGGGGIYGSGGVISGGRGTMAFGVGGLVNKPTVFPMANGAGLMGEAGAEAILPLKRGTDGKLGVGGGAAGSGGGVNVVVNDMRSGGQQVESQDERGPDGKRLIRLTIRDEVKGQMKSGTYDPEMRSQYGASRQLARR